MQRGHHPEAHRAVSSEWPKRPPPPRVAPLYPSATCARVQARLGAPVHALASCMRCTCMRWCTYSSSTAGTIGMLHTPPPLPRRVATPRPPHARARLGPRARLELGRVRRQLSRLILQNGGILSDASARPSVVLDRLTDACTHPVDTTRCAPYRAPARPPTAPAAHRGTHASEPRRRSPSPAREAPWPWPPPASAVDALALVVIGLQPRPRHASSASSAWHAVKSLPSATHRPRRTCAARPARATRAASRVGSAARRPRPRCSATPAGCR
jgi:hypothetical protein